MLNRDEDLRWVAPKRYGLGCLGRLVVGLRATRISDCICVMGKQCKARVTRDASRKADVWLYEEAEGQLTNRITGR